MKRTARLALALLLLTALPAVAQTRKAPRRVVSLAPSLTEMLFALGAGDTVVGVTSYCNYPPAADRLPEVGGMQDGTVDAERVLSLRPDLVVSIGEGQHGTVEALKRLGLRVEVLRSQTLSDVFPAIDGLGRLLGREAAARRVNGDLSRRIDRVRKVTATLPAAQRPRVFYIVWDQPLMTGTDDTLIGQLIPLAGGVNIFGDLPGQYVQVSPEALLERNPQVIVAPDQHSAPVNAAALAKRPGLSGVDAVRNKRIIVLEGDMISRVGPRIADALEALAHALHPRHFPAPRKAAPPGGKPR